MSILFNILILTLSVVSFRSACAEVTDSEVILPSQKQTYRPDIIERWMETEYRSRVNEAKRKGVLAKDNDPQLIRLRRIMNQLLPAAHKLNPNSKNWNWELNLTNTKTINANATAGGKIMFYRGLAEKMTDSEIAFVMGHEMSHACHNHIHKSLATGVALTGAAVGGSIYLESKIAQRLGSSGPSGAALGLGAIALLYLKDGFFQAGTHLADKMFSRSHETEADNSGAVLAASSGFDPRGAITANQKLSKFSGGKEGLEFLSTHPLSSNRVKNLESQYPRLKQLYEQSLVAQKNNETNSESVNIID